MGNGKDKNLLQRKYLGAISSDKLNYDAVNGCQDLLNKVLQ